MQYYSNEICNTIQMKYAILHKPNMQCYSNEICIFVVIKQCDKNDKIQYEYFANS